jgi:hypothetical protein
MEEVLVIFETAKLAKEKGFNAGCDGRWYIEPGSDWKYSKQGLFKCDNTGDSIARPTQSLLQKWLREVYGLYVEVMVSNRHIPTKGLIYSFIILKPDLTENRNVINHVTTSKEPFDSYEEALEVGLQEALKLV